MDKHTCASTAAHCFGAVVFGGALIGFSAIFVKLSPVAPTATAFYRLALSLPILACFWALPLQGGRSGFAAFRSAGWRWPLLIPGTFFACDIGVWHWSIKYTSVANATLLGNLCPVFVTLVAWLFFHERVTRLFLCGLACALIGTIVLLGVSLGAHGDFLLGDMLALVSAAFYAGYQLSIKQLRRRYDPLSLMMMTGLSGVVLLAAATYRVGESFAWRGEAFYSGLAILLGLAWLCHAGGQGLIVAGMKGLPASLSSVVLLVQPIVTAIAGWLCLGQRLGLLQLCGGGIVCIGIVLAHRGSLLTPRAEGAGPKMPDSQSMVTT